MVDFVYLPRSETHIDPWPRWRPHGFLPVAVADLADLADRATFNLRLWALFWNINIDCALLVVDGVPVH